MSSLYSQQSLSQRELDKNYSTTPANQRFYSYVWNDSYGDLLALTAIGLDGQPYFANSFLMGFVPFELDNAWATSGFDQHA